MKNIYFIALIFLSVICSAISSYCLAENQLPGKDLYSKIKGPYGSCNTCHPNGGSAGRWDSEFNEISDDGDKVIPSLKGIGKKKTPEQLEKIIGLMKTKYKIPIQNSQIKSLVDYLLTL